MYAKFAMLAATGMLAAASCAPRSRRSDEEKGNIDKQIPVLGRFEYSLMGAVEILGPDAFGARIGRYLSEKLRRDVTAPQVYATLERLAKRGLVRSEITDPVHVRGGRSRRRFIIEADGARALRHTSAVLNAVPNASDRGVETHGTARETKWRSKQITA